jgi:hypothetical protein
LSRRGRLCTAAGSWAPEGATGDDAAKAGSLVAGCCCSCCSVSVREVMTNWFQLLGFSPFQSPTIGAGLN